MIRQLRKFGIYESLASMQITINRSLNVKNVVKRIDMLTTLRDTQKSTFLCQRHWRLVAEYSLYESEATRDQEIETSNDNDGVKLPLTLIKNNTDTSEVIEEEESIYNYSDTYK